jgi:hypothetical protein
VVSFAGLLLVRMGWGSEVRCGVIAGVMGVY